MSRLPVPNVLACRPVGHIGRPVTSAGAGQGVGVGLGLCPGRVGLPCRVLVGVVEVDGADCAVVVTAAEPEVGAGWRAARVARGVEGVARRGDVAATAVLGAVGVPDVCGSPAATG